ncbi:hypothetical protein BCV70DRAFT_53867 [Testicularia cyperi]|uniref:Uncharacterized protein n=1 Tax=Testicularia cyperi TaxID=1882483 RepID=A0A317XUG7_9BASI|nr:hypothetical protein BCV70DRAFT_53867 [Testicularia cyperi]
MLTALEVDARDKRNLVGAELGLAHVAVRVVGDVGVFLVSVAALLGDTLVNRQVTLLDDAAVGRVASHHVGGGACQGQNNECLDLHFECLFGEGMSTHSFISLLLWGSLHSLFFGLIACVVAREMGSCFLAWRVDDTQVDDSETLLSDYLSAFSTVRLVGTVHSIEATASSVPWCWSPNDQNPLSLFTRCRSELAELDGSSPISTAKPVGTKLHGD